MNDYSYNNENNEQQTNNDNNGNYRPVNDGFDYNKRQYVSFETSELYRDKAFLKKNKKILRKMGTIFGLAILAYILLSEFLSFALVYWAKSVPQLKELLSNSTGLWAVQGLLSVVCLGVPFSIAYFWLRAKKYIGVLPFGTTYNKKASVSLVMFLAPVVLISTVAINLISAIIQNMLGLTFSSGLEDIEVNGFLGAITLTITIAVIPAIIEEFCIRGVLLQSLRRYGDKFAIVMSALIFAILHGNMVQAPYAFIGGLYFGYLCVSTGSIWPSIILHFINNFTQVIETVIISENNDFVSAVGIIILWGILIAMGIVGGIIFFKMNYKPELKSGVSGIKTGKKATWVLLNVPMILAIFYLFISVLSSISS